MILWKKTIYDPSFHILSFDSLVIWFTTKTLPVFILLTINFVNILVLKKTQWQNYLVYVHKSSPHIPNCIINGCVRIILLI